VENRGADGLRSEAERLRALHEKGRPLVLVNAWDAATARLLEKSGSAAIGTTSAGIAFADGYPDGQKIPRERMLDAVGKSRRHILCPELSRKRIAPLRDPGMRFNAMRRVVTRPGPLANMAGQSRDRIVVDEHLI